MKATIASPGIPLRDGQIWPLNIAAYRALGDAGLMPKNTELLYGIVYQKMSKSPIHSALVRRLLKLLAKIPLHGRLVTSEQPITCHDSEPEPDVAVVRGQEEDFWRHHPQTADLVLEVSVTSHEYDRSKLGAYSQAGVREVWLALAPERQIEVYRRNEAGQMDDPIIYGPGGQLRCVAVPEFTLNLDTFFEK